MDESTFSTARSTAREFLVIVVGVLTALAAESAYSSRGDAALAQEYRDRLLQELELNASFVEEELLMTNRQVAVGESLKPFFDRGEVRDRTEIVGGVYNMGRRYVYDLVEDTYADLLATGNIRLFDDAAERAALASAAGALRYAVAADRQEEEYMTHVRSHVTDSQAEQIRATCASIAATDWDCDDMRVDDPYLDRTIAALDNQETLRAFNARLQALRRLAVRLQRTERDLDEALSVLRRGSS